MLDAAFTDQLPETLTIEHDGRTMPLREHPFVKDAKDFPTFVKTAFDAHREVGARVRLPGKDSKPEDVSAFRTKLYEQGILTAPPGKPEEYGLGAAPKDLPAGVGWNAEAAGKLATILHKHGVAKEAVPDLLALQQELVVANTQSLKTSREEGEKALKAEFKDKYDETKESAARLATLIFKTPEEVKYFEDMGLGNDPKFLGVLMRLAPLAMQDSAFLIAGGSGGDGSMTGEQATQELRDIATNVNHPMHAGYLRGDRKVMAHIDQTYKKAYGDKQVEIA